MRKLCAIVLFLLIVSTALPLLEQSSPQSTIVVNPSPSVPSSIIFKRVTLEARVVNSTYARFRLTVWVANPSNQTLFCVVEVTPSTPYRTYYPFALSPPTESKPYLTFEVEAASEKFGKLNITKDEVTARATLNLEANGEDRVHLNGWMVLVQVRRLIWREYIEDYVGFSVRPAAEYVGILPIENTIDVKIFYPADYTRTDEANYVINVTDGYKMISYSDRFYGGYGLSFNLYKSRVPANSFVVFLALWTGLVAIVIKVRTRLGKKG